ncbi:MAG TPA: 2-amino-4-hydroxy-6-hydroxymethyldihydropteridine diphosphokinase [Anaerolineales bacterium]
MAHTVFIALGSNLGDRLANLKAAIASLAPQVQPELCSPVYETPPWGYADQPHYLNQVIRARTELDPQALLDHLKQVESRIGRKPTFRYGPRVIDLDILFYDDLVLEAAQLKIPHPRLPGRAFVLVPLAEIAPDLRHPVLGLTARDLLDEVDANEIAWYAPGECGELDRSGINLPIFEEE